MLSRIRHRGPDEAGFISDGALVMGNVRLSIIDLSGGTQPLADPTGRYWIVYNGELFNYLELRDELARRGRKFLTRSDTEVVLNSYIEWGAEALHRFNGQFAFAIWDRTEKRLFLARDRAGIRPLFYHFNNGYFAFCSEIKGLFEIPGIERGFSVSGLQQAARFWTTITPETPYRDIFELSPGSWMEVSEGKINTGEYWRPPFPPAGQLDKEKSVDAWIEELGALLTDSVRIRLRSDVEVAAYLSGGLDSTLTTALIKKIEPRVLHTFSIGFREKDFDESGYQNLAARELETQHSHIYCSNEDIGNAFTETVWYAEYPVIRTAPAPMYLLSGLVRQNGIKVVITGEGADELFAGYNIFKESEIRRFWARFPDSEIRPLLLKRLYPYIPAISQASPAALKLFFGYRLNETDNPFYSHLLRWNNTARIGQYFSTDIREGMNNEPIDLLSSRLPEDFSRMTPLARAQYLEFTLFMSNYLLSSQGDRMALGHSVEGRYPFLDHRLIELAARMPDRLKLNGLNEKYILKRFAAGMIPYEVIHRNKQPYRAPVSQSLLNHPTGDAVRGYLETDEIRKHGIFEPERVEKLITKLTFGRNVSETDQMALAFIVSTQILAGLMVSRDHQPSKLKTDTPIKEISL